MTGLETVHFEIPFRAPAKGNKQKVAKWGRKRGIVRDFDGSMDESTREFREKALLRIEQAVRDTLPWKHPVFVTVTFCFEVPSPSKSWPQWKIDAALQEEFDGRWHYDQNPDLDNVEKFVYDALEKAFYVNDKQIFKKSVEKRYAVEDRIVVSLRPIPQPSAPKKAKAKKKTKKKRKTS